MFDRFIIALNYAVAAAGVVAGLLLVVLHLGGGRFPTSVADFFNRCTTLGRSGLHGGAPGLVEVGVVVAVVVALWAIKELRR